MGEKDKLKDKQTQSRKLLKKIGIYFGATLAIAALLAGGVYGYLYFSTPEQIRKPAFQHYHFRTQLLIDGKAVDFSKNEFQGVKSNTVACSAEVGGAPIDFHDNVDQFTHIHWDGITGGQFLKYYGWNLIGGEADTLGWRFDNGLLPSTAKTYGEFLPAVPKQSSFYVYIGGADGYEKKSWDEFLSQDLEEFFGKQSNIGGSTETTFNPLDWLTPTAHAHNGIPDGHDSDESEEEKLTRINNLIGNVVIFAQREEPSESQVKERFNDLVPLQESTCGD